MKMNDENVFQKVPTTKEDLERLHNALDRAQALGGVSLEDFETGLRNFTEAYVESTRHLWDSTVNK